MGMTPSNITSITPGTLASNLGKAEDAIHASGDTGVMSLAVRRDTPSNTTATAGNYSALINDADGRLYVNPLPATVFSATTPETAAQTNKSLRAAPGVGLSLYVTDIFVSNGATAGSITFSEDVGGTPVVRVQPIYLPINGSQAITLSTPLKITSNKSFGFTSTTVTTHSVTISGFIAP